MTNENKKKRYYWIKLKDGFFDTDEIDFLLSQKNGSDYVVLYQMLCLKTINTKGNLVRTVGEMLMKYDEEKIQRECKYFTLDTVRIALSLYKKLGLVYEEEDGTIQIVDFENMVGSETQGAIEKREQRANKITIDRGIDKQIDNVYQDNRYKEIKSIESKNNLVSISKECVSKETTGTHTHDKPTLTDVTEYVKSQGLQVNAKRFFNYYESVGWKINGEPIRDWRARLRLWDSEDKGGNNGRYGEINDL